MKRIMTYALLLALPAFGGCSSTRSCFDVQKRLEACEAGSAALQASNEADAERLKKHRQRIEAGLKTEIAGGLARVSELKGRLSVSLVDTVLFNSGEAELRPEARDVLDKVGAFLKDIPDRDVRIEGHTDSVAIGAKLKYIHPTNWGLSAARSVEIARYLHEVVKLNPERLSAVGYGKYRPIADNSTAKGRSLNRRIEIQLVAPE